MKAPARRSVWSRRRTRKPPTQCIARPTGWWRMSSSRCRKGPSHAGEPGGFHANASGVLGGPPLGAALGDAPTDEYRPYSPDHRENDVQPSGGQPCEQRGQQGGRSHHQRAPYRNHHAALAHGVLTIVLTRSRSKTRAAPERRPVAEIVTASGPH